jgi:hypothetical protein
MINQDLYPAHPVDAELSNSNKDGQDDPAGDDAGGQGAPSAESTASNLIRPGMAERVRPFVTD